MVGGVRPSVGCSTVPRGAAGLMGCPGVSSPCVHRDLERVVGTSVGSTAVVVTGAVGATVEVAAAVEACTGICLGGREASIAAISLGVGVRGWWSVRWRVLRAGVDWSVASGTVS